MLEFVAPIEFVLNYDGMPDRERDQDNVHGYLVARTTGGREFVIIPKKLVYLHYAVHIASDQHLNRYIINKNVDNTTISLLEEYYDGDDKPTRRPQSFWSTWVQSLGNYGGRRGTYIYERKEDEPLFKITNGADLNDIGGAIFRHDPIGFCIVKEGFAIQLPAFTWDDLKLSSKKATVQPIKEFTSTDISDPAEAAVADKPATEHEQDNIPSADPVRFSYEELYSALTSDLDAGRLQAALLKSLEACPTDKFRHILREQHAILEHARTEFARNGDYFAWKHIQNTIAESIHSAWRTVLDADAYPIEVPRTCRAALPDWELVALDTSVQDHYVAALIPGCRMSITGHSGTGKSSLAYQIAAMTAFTGTFSEIIWVELEESPTWATFISSYQACNPSYEPHGPTPKEHVAHLLSHISGRDSSILIILDNLNNPLDNELESFIDNAPSNCAMLSTSTSSSLVEKYGFNVPAGQHLQWDPYSILLVTAWLCRDPELKPLADGARRAIHFIESEIADEIIREPHRFRGEMGSDEEIANACKAYELCRRIGNNPKVLQYAIAQLRTGCAFSDIDSVDTSDLASTIHYAMHRWNSLSDNAKKISAFITPHTDGIHTELVVAISGMHLDIAIPALRELKAQHLIALDPDISSEGGVIKCHSLDRQVIRSGLSSDGIWNLECSERVLDYLRNTDNKRRGLELCGKLLVRALRTLRGSPGAGARVSLVADMHEQLKRGGHWNIASEASEIAFEEGLVARADQACVRVGLDIRSWMMFWRGSYTRCLNVLDEVEKLSIDEVSLRKLKRRRYHCFVYLGDYHSAELGLDALLDSTESDSEKVDILHVMTQLELQRERYDAAIELSTETQRIINPYITEDDNMEKERAVGLYYMAKAQRLSGSVQAALDSLFEACNISTRLQLLPSLAYDMLGMAQCLLAGGVQSPVKSDPARLASEALRLFDKLGDTVRANECVDVLSKVKARDAK